MAINNGSKYLTSPSDIPITADGGSDERTLSEWAALGLSNTEGISEILEDAGELLVTSTGSDTSRTLSERFGDTLSVLDFGLYAALDHTSIFQSAVDAAEGKSLLIPAGTYTFSDPGVFLKSNLTIRGAGKGATILKKKSAVGTSDELAPIFREDYDGSFLPISNVILEGLSFEGNGNPDIPSDKGAGLFRLYENYGIVVRDCEFYNCKGYGVGLEGASASPNSDRRGPHEDATFINCDFYNNGRAEYLTGSDTDDGIDAKSSDRLTLINCRAWGNGDKGFDYRARSATLIDCHSWENGSSGFSAQIEGVQSGTTAIEDASASHISCYAFDNGGAGFSIIPQVTTGVVDGRQEVTYTSCDARRNSNNYSVASQGTNDLAVVSLELVACRSTDPATGTRHLLCSAPTNSVMVNGGKYRGGTTTALSVNSADQGSFTVTAATLENIGGNAIQGSGDSTATMTVSGVTFNGVAGLAVNGDSNCTVSGNTYIDVSSSQLVNFSGSENRVYDKAVGIRSVASSATLDIPSYSDHFIVTGSTNINAMTAGYVGRTVSLRFTGSLTFSSGSGVSLASALDTSVNKRLVLVCEGATWYEVSRA